VLRVPCLLQRALRLEPGDGELWEGLAAAYQALGRHTASLKVRPTTGLRRRLGLRLGGGRRAQPPRARCAGGGAGEGGGAWGEGRSQVERWLSCASASTVSDSDSLAASELSVAEGPGEGPLERPVEGPPGDEEWEGDEGTGEGGGGAERPRGEWPASPAAAAVQPRQPQQQRGRRRRSSVSVRAEVELEVALRAAGGGGEGAEEEEGCGGPSGSCAEAEQGRGAAPPWAPGLDAQG
jgi:hypothetical protein